MHLRIAKNKLLNDASFRLMMMETRKYGFKHILIEDNHLFIMRDERILTGCKANRSSFRGLVRLVPKIMNPELMPAEWRALSKLKRREKNLNICIYLQHCTLLNRVNGNNYTVHLCHTACLIWHRFASCILLRIMVLQDISWLTLKWTGQQWTAVQPG